MIETHVAVQGVCAWPNLKKFPDGTLVATIFNQPCHGRWEGDLDCWASTDGGFVWNFRGRACPHEPGTNRMNCAAGFAKNGDMIVLCSGWDNRGKPYGEPKPFEESKTLRPWICRSSDQATTWQKTGELPDSQGESHLIPFGDILIAEDGSLRASAYTLMSRKGSAEWAVFMLISDDDGRTWRAGSKITPFGNETALLGLGKKRWLAAVRTPGSVKDKTNVPADRNAPEQAFWRLLNLHASDDDGETWRWLGPVSLTGQIPGHLLRLADGRIVLSYGNRCPNNLGIDARVSQDDGATWGRPIRIANMLPGDGGYPSTVELEKGKLVTAFYNKVSGSLHFEMSVSRWDINEFDKVQDAPVQAW